MPDATRRAVLACGAAALLAGCGQVTRLRQGLEFAVVNERLLLCGVIHRRTPAAFADVLAENPQLRCVVLQQMQGAGDTGAVLAMGRLLRAAQLDTALQSDSDLHGDAVFLFAAGGQRRMVQGAQIHLGGWATPDFARTPEAGLTRSYLADMLGQAGFLNFALQASAGGGIHTMTAREIAQHGLLTAPVTVFE